MAEPMDVRPPALGYGFLSLTSVKYASGATSSDHPFCRYDACKNCRNWACFKTNLARRRVSARITREAMDRLQRDGSPL
jgi:hypothetical protein